MPQGFEVIGLQQFQRNLTKVLAENPRKFKELMFDLGTSGLNNAASSVPRKKGHLKDSYLKNYSYKGKQQWFMNLTSSDMVEYGTKVFYASMVENGHDIVLIKRFKGKDKKGRSRTRRKKIKVGYVTGKKYFSKSLPKTNSDIPDLINNFLRRLGMGAGFDVTT
jgi:hypothetical protein